MDDLILFLMVYAGYVGLIVLFCKSRHKIPIMGSLVGYTIWLSDYDFLINFGGPSTPISDYICRTLGLQDCCCRNPAMFAPLLLLVAAGGAAGFALSIPFIMRRRRPGA